MTVKKVTTSIDEKLWREAVLANVRWSEALTAGIKLHLGSTAKKDELIKQKKFLKGELKHVEERISEIEKKENKAQDFEQLIKDNLDLIKKATPLVMEDINRLKAWTRVWVKRTHKKITEDQFFKICKRYDGGEFKK